MPDANMAGVPYPGIPQHTTGPGYLPLTAVAAHPTRRGCWCQWHLLLELHAFLSTCCQWPCYFLLVVRCAVSPIGINNTPPDIRQSASAKSWSGVPKSKRDAADATRVNHIPARGKCETDVTAVRSNIAPCGREMAGCVNSRESERRALLPVTARFETKHWHVHRPIPRPIR